MSFGRPRMLIFIKTVAWYSAYLKLKKLKARNNKIDYFRRLKYGLPRPGVAWKQLEKFETPNIIFNKIDV